ncbi:hypothetical protein STEG23_032654, partial [Scotinomys teguina]
RQQDTTHQAEGLPHTVPQQETPQVPVLLNWPIAFLPTNATPVTLSPQMMISFSCDHCQSTTIRCLLSNVITQPCDNAAPPVLAVQVLQVSSTCFQGPENANQAQVISNQINDVSNQLHDTHNRAPEGTTQLSNVSNQGALSAEVDRQKVLDAAEALLILHNSPQACQETCSTPGSVAEDPVRDGGTTGIEEQNRAFSEAQIPDSEGLESRVTTSMTFVFLCAFPLPSLALSTMEQGDKVDVPGCPSTLGSNMDNRTGAPLGVESQLGGPENQPGTGQSFGAMTQASEKHGSLTTEEGERVHVPVCHSNSECNMENKTDALLGIEPGLRGAANQPGIGTMNQASEETASLTTEQNDRVDVLGCHSNSESNVEHETDAPLGREPGLRGPGNDSGTGHSFSAMNQASETPTSSTKESDDKGDDPCWPSTSECNPGNKTGALEAIEPGLRGRAKHRGRGQSGTRTQARTTKQRDQVDVLEWASSLECNPGNKTGAPQAIEPGFRGRGRKHGRGPRGARTKARTTKKEDQVDVPGWASTSEGNPGNKTGAPQAIEPGFRGCGRKRGRGPRSARTKARTTKKDQVDVPGWASTSEGNPGNKTGAPLAIEPGRRGHAEHCGRGNSGARTQAREYSEALPALGSEKKVYGTPLRTTQIQQPIATGAVAHQTLRQGKNSLAKTRGHTGKENTVCQPEVLPFTRPQEQSSQGPVLLGWSPTVSTPPYVTVTFRPHLIVSPSVELREAVASSHPVPDLSPLPCSSMEHQPPETQGPTASEQASVSESLECQEILDAAVALMILKNSSWKWRQTHN